MQENTLSKMIKLAVANRKGGVSKTTLCQVVIPWFTEIVELSAAVIDLDPQANISNRFLPMRQDSEGDWFPPPHPEAKHDQKMLEEELGKKLEEGEITRKEYEEEIEHSYPEDFSMAFTDLFEGYHILPYPTKIPNLDIFPVRSTGVDKFNSESDSDKSRVIRATFNRALNSPEFKEWGYDIVIFDTPPEMRNLTLSSVRAATHAIIPCVMEKKSIEGLTSVIKKIKRQNVEKIEDNKIAARNNITLGSEEPTKICGIIATQVSRTKPIQMKHLGNTKEKLGDLMFDAPFFHRTSVTRLDELVDLGVDEEIALVAPFSTKFCPRDDRLELIKMCMEITDRLGIELSDEKLKAMSEKTGFDLVTMKKNKEYGYE